MPGQTGNAGVKAPFSVQYKKFRLLSTSHENWLVSDSEDRTISYRDDNGCERTTEYNSDGKFIRETATREGKTYIRLNEYDGEGRIIRNVNSHGFEEKIQYGENGSEIHRIRNSENMELIEMNSDKNIIHMKNSVEELWNEYNENGKKIRSEHRTSSGASYEERWDYDDKGNEIHYIIEGVKGLEGHSAEKKGTPFTREQWRKYDEKGNLTLFRNSDGYEELHEYDKSGHETHKKTSDGIESWQKYNEQGLMTQYKDSSGFYEVREYDSRGNNILIYDSEKNWAEYEYNERGDETHFKNKSEEVWKEYDEQGRLVRIKYISESAREDTLFAYVDSLDLVKSAEAALRKKSFSEDLKEKAVSATARFNAEKELQSEKQREPELAVASQTYTREL